MELMKTSIKAILDNIICAEEFLDEAKIRQMLLKYCRFMPYEIYLNSKDEKDSPVNDTMPLWKKSPKDCTKEEYEKFYSEVFFDMNGKDGRDFLMQTQIEHKEQKAK